VLQSAGFKPDAEGVDPNLPHPAPSVDPNVIVEDVKNKRTGMGFSQGGDTNPVDPAPLPQPTPGPEVGMNDGIETARGDGV
ncbi:MAG: hypothetical protein ACRDAM_20545, partial [Casimicrobium sp.]